VDAVNAIPGGASSFTVYPAIDVRGGRVVRLRQGDYARETDYDLDPAATAARYADAGAGWLHLVDLDAARAGGYTLYPLLERLKRGTGLAVQTGGGVRVRNDVARLFEAGADRVVVGSIAIRQPDVVAGWLSEFGRERIVVALDVRRDDAGAWWPAVAGWTATSRTSLQRLLAHYAAQGAVHVLTTDIGRDGMLSGPNLALYESMRAWAPDLRVQASGGVRGVADVAAVRALGCGGVVLGRALLEGRVDLRGALAC
jgi:phosphoribosylformimino-5-aminoimidazole carboxamide ribotide isomerase